MDSRISKEALELLQQGEQAASVLVTEEQVLRLPEVMQRYLRYAQVIGKETIRTVRLKQQGAMRLKPGQRWFPMVAEQYYTTRPPAFVWYGKIQPFPLVSISSRDRFYDGHGSMRIKLMSLITVGDARGAEMDQGSLGRYLGEIIWFPTAWLSDAIRWQALDDRSVRATIQVQSATAALVLHVNEQGELTHTTGERYMAVEHGKYKIETWSAYAQEYQEVQGMRIPSRVEVAWKLASGDFSYFRCKIAEIEYNG